jgi:voltage-gated potassium channel
MAPWRQRLHEIIFEADTPAGKAFDVALLVAILLSVLSVSLETVDPIDARYHLLLESVEWIFTILFTIEYVLRLICVPTWWRSCPRT